MKRKTSNIHSIEMNNYVKPCIPDVSLTKGKEIFNGENNSYFQYVEDRYNGSPTNAAVIDSYTNYILGEGLQTDVADFNINSIIPKADLRLIIKDFKMQGQCALQVVYNKGVGKDRKVAKVYHIPAKRVAISKTSDVLEEVSAYWYCYDWAKKRQYPPEEFPAFGTTENANIEILVLKIPSNQQFYSLPDYQSGLQYCEMEEELSNYYINHIKNGLSFGYIINVVRGVEDTEEAEIEAEKKIKAKLTGSSNAGKYVLSFNDNAESKTTVETIEVSEAHKQYEFLTQEARDKILMAHKVVNPILFGVNTGTGFSNNAQEMETALKTLYRSQINPLREIIIDGLESILRVNFNNINIYFKDFKELNINNN